MKNVKKILIPYDFSETSQAALKQGILLSRKLQANLLVLYVLEKTPNEEILKLTFPSGDLRSKLENKIQGELRSLVNAEPESKISIETRVVVGKPAVEILLMTEKEKADLVVMGSHGHTGLKRLWLGSVTERVVQRAKIPVLVHRGKTEIAPTRILIPIDFSEYSKEGLELGLQWAKIFNAKPYFFHVIILQDLYSFKDLFVPINSSIEEALKEEARIKLADWTKEINMDHHLEIKMGNPSLEIEREVHAHSIDLVVLATHGQTGLKHFLMGSVAEQTVRHSPCSVLTVRPAEFYESTFK